MWWHPSTHITLIGCQLTCFSNARNEKSALLQTKWKWISQWVFAWDCFVSCAVCIPGLSFRKPETWSFCHFCKAQFTMNDQPFQQWASCLTNHVPQSSGKCCCTATLPTIDINLWKHSWICFINELCHAGVLKPFLRDFLAVSLSSGIPHKRVENERLLGTSQIRRMQQPFEKFFLSLWKHDMIRLMVMPMTNFAKKMSVTMCVTAHEHKRSEARPKPIEKPKFWPKIFIHWLQKQLALPSVDNATQGAAGPTHQHWKHKRQEMHDEIALSHLEPKQATNLGRLWSAKVVDMDHNKKPAQLFHMLWKTFCDTLWSLSFFAVFCCEFRICQTMLLIHAIIVLHRVTIECEDHHWIFNEWQCWALMNVEFKDQMFGVMLLVNDCWTNRAWMHVAL